MKVLLLVLFLGAQTYCINACFEFTKERIDFGVLQNTVERKCASNGNDKQFMKSIEYFASCISDSAQNSTTPSQHALESSKNLCSFLQESKFNICLERFTTDISPCLSENEIYIKQLLLNAYDSAYEELCGNDGASNFQYLNDKVNGTGVDCIIISGQLFVRFGLCTGNLNIFKELDKGVFNLNKQDVCRDLESFHNCSTEVLESICNDELSRFTNLILRPLLVSCGGLNASK